MNLACHFFHFQFANIMGFSDSSLIEMQFLCQFYKYTATGVMQVKLSSWAPQGFCLTHLAIDVIRLLPVFALSYMTILKTQADDDECLHSPRIGQLWSHTVACADWSIKMYFLFSNMRAEEMINFKMANTCISTATPFLLENILLFRDSWMHARRHPSSQISSSKISGDENVSALYC